MRYVVHAEVPAEIGNRLEREGDPFSKLTPIFDRFKPESVYFGMARRELFIVVTLNEPMELGELTVSLCQLLGAYPNIHPVITLTDMQAADPGQMKAVMERVRRLT